MNIHSSLYTIKYTGALALMAANVASLQLDLQHQHHQTQAMHTALLKEKQQASLLNMGNIFLTQKLHQLQASYESHQLQAKHEKQQALALQLANAVVVESATQHAMALTPLVNFLNSDDNSPPSTEVLKLYHLFTEKIFRDEQRVLLQSGAGTGHWLVKEAKRRKTADMLGRTQLRVIGKGVTANQKLKAGVHDVNNKEVVAAALVPIITRQMRQKEMRPIFLESGRKAKLILFKTRISDEHLEAMFQLCGETNALYLKNFLKVEHGLGASGKMEIRKRRKAVVPSDYDSGMYCSDTKKCVTFYRLSNLEEAIRKAIRTLSDSGRLLWHSCQDKGVVSILMCFDKGGNSFKTILAFPNQGEGEVASVKSVLICSAFTGDTDSRENIEKVCGGLFQAANEINARQEPWLDIGETQTSHVPFSKVFMDKVKSKGNIKSQVKTRQLALCNPAGLGTIMFLRDFPSNVMYDLRSNVM